TPRSPRLRVRRNFAALREPSTLRVSEEGCPREPAGNPTGSTAVRRPAHNATGFTSTGRSNMKAGTRAPALLATLALLAACAGAPADDRPRDVRQYTIEEFLGTTTVLGASFSPDGSKILVSSDETGVFNAFAVPVDGGEPVQLTHSTTDAVIVASYFPKDERFLYLSDQGGNELTHVYVQAPDGTVQDLTPGENLEANCLGWADDDASLCVSTTERDPRFCGAYEVTA